MNRLQMRWRDMFAELGVPEARRDLGLAAVHALELREPFFSDVLEGRKTFEVRWERPGRQFAEGDVLAFTDPADPARTFQRVVVYVLRDLAWYGVPEGLAVLGLETQADGE